MRNLFRFIVLFLALSHTVCVFAIEQIQAKTLKPAIIQTEPDNFDNFYPQKDGMELKFPKIKKNKSTEAVPAKKSEITMDSDEVEYRSETNEVEAKGHVIVIAKPDNIKLTADRGVFDRNSNIIKLYDNVTLYKDGGKINGDFMSVNLNEENILMNEPIGNFANFKITGREGYAYANKLESVNGEIALAQKMNVTLASYGFGTMYDQTILQPALATDSIRQKRADTFKIHTKEIVIKSDKEHDDVTFKNADIYYKKFKLATAANIQVFTDKEQNYAETNIPELGSMADFGTYVGPGVVFKAPGSSTIKLVPVLLSNDEGLGFGGIVRHRSKRNFAEAAYSANNKNFILRGKYKFNKELWIDYGHHAYIDEWFYGARRPGNLVQLVHDKKWEIESLKAEYQQRLTAGYVSEYDFVNPDNENEGTARIRYQSQLSKILFSIGDREQDMYLDLLGYAQVGATVYGKGNSTGVIRVGPQIESRIKNWGSRIGFALSGIHGSSPYYFDDYRYGKTSVMIDQNLRLNKYIALGYQGTFTPMKDNPEEKLIAENRFYVVAGPEDVKVAFSYDTERELAFFDVVFLLGSDSLKSKYDKLTIENMDSLGKKRELFEDLKYYKIKVPEDL